ncbi:primase-helicase family protein [Pelagimonas varians]|uniref:NrS-1 polymerase-like helicase domain-containing protein n=1 Tax=Pelagimonas varians TaxID=696760 RepID=A0A238K9P2_9RHOB|nr:primase-helicase family protein [Pelagimonas varians]PYG31729.1 hypothetical protein C8N36_104149 [Pelagimonas varians]SMX38696.1 hypothetical protein PEV8663_01495 [Pelagimonas varians]
MGGFSDLGEDIKERNQYSNGVSLDKLTEMAMADLEKQRAKDNNPLLKSPTIKRWLMDNDAVVEGLRITVIRGADDGSGYPVALAEVRFPQNPKNAKGVIRITKPRRSPLTAADLKELMPSDDDLKAMYGEVMGLEAEGMLPVPVSVEPTELCSPFVLKNHKENEWYIEQGGGNGIPDWLSGVVVSLENWPRLVLGEDRCAVPVVDAEGRITAIEFRVKKADGGKICQHYRPFSDGIWRVDTEELNLVKGGGKGRDTVLFEGAKALAGALMIAFPEKYGVDKDKAERHPWYDFLQGKVLRAFIGGTNVSHRINWEPMKDGTGAIYVANDADASGVGAAKDISMAPALKGRQVFRFDFPEYFPNGWDIADGLSDVAAAGEKYYRQQEGVEKFDPAIHLNPKNLLRKITQVATGSKTATYIPKSIDDWGYVKQHDEFTDLQDPSAAPKKKKEKEFERTFDDRAPTTNGLAPSFRRNGVGVYDGYEFSPHKPAIISQDGKRLVNHWQPRRVEPVEPKTPQDIAPLVRYFEHLLPNPWERLQIWNWVATAIAHQDWKIPAVLIHGPVQGTGKSMLMDVWIAPILGFGMVSRPNVDNLGSEHRTWMVNKVMVNIDDLPNKESKDRADLLKSVITAGELEVNPKNRHIRAVKNHATLYCTSQYATAVMLSNDGDRRWLIAGSGEEKLRNFAEIRDYANGVGRGHLVWIAENYENLPDWLAAEIGIGGDDVPSETRGDGGAIGDLGKPKYLPSGKQAPWTSSKAETRAQSGSAVVLRATEALRAVIEERTGKDERAYFSDTLYESIARHGRKHGLSDGSIAQLRPQNLGKSISSAGLYSCRANQNNPSLPNYMRANREIQKPDGSTVPVRKYGVLLLPKGIVDELEQQGLIKVNPQEMLYEPHPSPSKAVVKKWKLKVGRVPWSVLKNAIGADRLMYGLDVTIWGDVNYEGQPDIEDDEPF